MSLKKRSLTSLSPRSSTLLLVVVTLLTAALYGYSVPNYPVLDDQVNLQIVNMLHEGSEGAAWELIWGNHSGVSSRAIPMLSFVVDAWRAPDDYAAMRVTNLILHHSIGWLVFGWLTVLLSALLASRSRAFVLSAVVTTLWMIAPIQISTVYYPVQRMAMWPLFFIFAALWHYTWVRVKLQDTRPRVAIAHLLVIYLFWLPLAWLSKETGALLPLFLALLELGLLRSFASPIGVWLKRGHQLVIGGVVAGFAYVVIEGSRITYGGVGSIRDFTVTDRIATQSFAIWDYMRQILFPDIARMGLWHDDFVIRSLSEWPALLLLSFTLVLFLGALLLLRARSLSLRLIGFGVAFFFIGHLLESTVFNLELYFEHRNYLPSIGLFLAAVVAVSSLIRPIRHAQRWLFLLFVCYLGLNLYYTSKEIRVWQLQPHLIAKVWENHPSSQRANLLAAEVMMILGQPQEALEIVSGMPDRVAIPRSREDRERVIALKQIYFSLGAGISPDPVLYERIRLPWPGSATHERSSTLNQLTTLPSEKLALLDWPALAKSADDILERPERLQSRSYAAYLLHAAYLAIEFEDMERAERYFSAVNRGSPHYLPWTTVPLFHFALDAGNLDGAKHYLSQLEQDARWSALYPGQISEMKSYIDRFESSQATQESDDAP